MNDAGYGPTMFTPLQGLKVVDLTTMIAGPTCSRLFAELGAEVIHIESPSGDDGRNTTTSYLGREGVMYSVANRNKQGIVLNLRDVADREALLRLVDGADLFVENTPPGRLEAIGLGYESLRSRNPRLVYVSISAWGREGALRDAPGYDILIQAFAGAMVRPPDGEIPLFSGALVADATAPLIAAFAAMVALRRRDTTGQGALVTTSLLQAALHTLGTNALVAEQDTSSSQGSKAPLPGGTSVFRAKGGRPIVVCAWTDAQFRRLCELTDYEHLAADRLYSTRTRRQEHAAALNELFAEWVARFEPEEALRRLREVDIPAAPIRTGFAELLDDPQVLANEFMTAVEHPVLGRLWQSSPAFEIDGARATLRAAPLLGEHTDAILSELATHDLP